MSSNTDSSYSANGTLSSSLFGGLETDGSLAAAVAASSISPDRQRDLLIQVSTLNHNKIHILAHILEIT